MPSISGSLCKHLELRGLVVQALIPQELGAAGLAGIGGYPGLGGAAQAQAMAQAAAGRYPGGGGGQGCVLLVSNMSDDQKEPDHLFILFCVYGDVQVC